MLRSPFPDVEVPDVALTDLVLARTGELGEKPALIDAPSGRTITYAQLAESVRAVAVGLTERGFGRATSLPIRPQPARVCGRVSRGRDPRRHQHDRQPAADRRRADAPAA